MTSFRYVAVDAGGREFQGDIREKSLTSALRRVKEMGLFATQVRATHQEAGLGGSAEIRVVERPRVGAEVKCRAHSGAGISGKCLVAYTRQLATLVEAGIPLIKGLRAIDKQERNRQLKRTLQALIGDIEGGAMFSEALAKHPRIFNRLYLNMVIAGETGGMLENALARLADFIERSQKIKAKIVSSLFYPAAVICVALSVLALLMLLIVPRFKDVFADLTGHRELPWFTEFVFSISLFLKSHALHIAVTLLASVVAIRLVGVTRWGRAALDRFRLNLPVVGVIIQKTAIARFSRTLGTLLQSGVPILQALTIARETTANSVFANVIDRLHAQVKEGDNLTPTLESSSIFPATVVSMIDVGEQTGALPDMLLKVADSYENDVDNLVNALMSLLEPVLIICLAVVVGSIVIALFLPLVALIGGGLEGSQDRSIG